MDHHMERHRAHSVVVGVTCPPRDHRVEHTKLVSCEPTMAIAWSTTGLKGCVGGVWHVPSTGPPCSVWDRGRRVRACVPPRGQLTSLEGAVAMRALPRVSGARRATENESVVAGHEGGHSRVDAAWHRLAARQVRQRVQQKLIR